MKSRHEARRIAFQALYQEDISGLGQEGAEKTVVYYSSGGSGQAFAMDLIRGTLRERGKIDGWLQDKAKNWKLSRMPAVDRNIIRLAVYELVSSEETPTSVIINEAIELAREYGSAQSPAFINGVLDSIAKELRQDSGESAPSSSSTPTAESSSSSAPSV